MIWVKDVYWISEKILEAEVLITDGVLSLYCFSHPFNYFKGSIINNLLHVLDIGCIEKSIEKKYIAKRINNSFEYYLVGKLIIGNESIIQLSKFNIKISSNFIPIDINSGEFVSFYCSRIDLY